MITLSVCMIVKNEEDVLARCLTCAQQFADEIIVVDTGSTDRTKEIAQEFTPFVYDFEWVEDFSAARNFSFSKATMDYCMWLDADDVIEPQDIEGILALKKAITPDISAVFMKYNTGFDAKGNVTFSYYRERIIKRDASLPWQGAVHEAISVYGKRLYSDYAITHRKIKVKDSDRNLRIYESEIAKGHSLCARDKFYYARELTYHGRDQDAVYVLNNVIDSPDVWLENKIEACRLLHQCYIRLEDKTKALSSLLRTLEADVPRAEVCCDIGAYFVQEENFRLAAHWYETALQCVRNDQSGAFVQPDAYNYIPHIQLCVCYYKLNNLEKAIYHNEEAGKVKPENASYLQNKAFFAGLAQKALS